MKLPLVFLLLLLLYSGISRSQAPMPFVHPDSLGMDAARIHDRIDSLITLGIKNEAFPGAQLLVAHQGKVIFHETYGFHTYDSVREVWPGDLYDLASVTKILGPLPALMKLVDEKKIDLDRPFSEYWKPWRRHGDKKYLSLREILAHQAGLVPYIVFLREVLRKERLKRRFVRPQPERRFRLQAYDSLYVKTRFTRKMYRMINRSEVSADKTYRYSGLAFLLFPELIREITGMPYESYLKQEFYLPLGCDSLMFNPAAKGYLPVVVPTEMDSLYRRSLTRGWVHDENASLFGGVSGNAGLFGTAAALARMMQMYQNYGEFGGIRYLSEAVVREFTRVQYPENDNRRGLGFDKPLPGNSGLPLSEAYPAPGASPESFGHSGFTGTFVWADPVNHLVFIFLSNRVYPTRNNRNLYTLNLRTALQQVFYDAVLPAN